MTSILNKIETKQPVEPIELVPEPIDNKKTKTRVLFVSDKDLDENLRKQINNWDIIAEYDKDTFTNRDLDYFLEQELNYLWVNLTKSKARDWLTANLDDIGERWKVVVITDDKEKASWVQQIKEFADLIGSFSDLKKIKSLTLDEMMKKLQKFRLSKPKTFLKKLLSCVGGCAQSQKK